LPAAHFLSFKIWSAANFVHKTPHFLFKKCTEKKCASHFFSSKNWPVAHFFVILSLNWDAFDLKFLILSTNLLVVKMIRTPILNNHNGRICTKQ